MSKQAAETVNQARARGTQVYGETLVAAIGSDGTHCSHANFHYSAGHILSPPLRSDPSTPLAIMNFLAQ